MNKKVWNGKFEKDGFSQLQESSAKVMGLKKEADNVGRYYVSMESQWGDMETYEIPADIYRKAVKLFNSKKDDAGNKINDLILGTLGGFEADAFSLDYQIDHGIDSDDEYTSIDNISVEDGCLILTGTWTSRDYPIVEVIGPDKDKVESLCRKISNEDEDEDGSENGNENGNVDVDVDIVKELDNGFKLVLNKRFDSESYVIYPMDKKIVSLEIGLPKIVDKGININKRGITSLKGAPREVGRSFNCANNQLTSLEGAPREVGRSFNCANNQLTSLKGAPREVGVHFDCNNNRLRSLEGCSQEIGGIFSCANNQLTSLKGAPIKVGNSFDCSNNQLKSLEGCPQEVGGNFWCGGNAVKFTEEDVRKVCNVRGSVIC